jgi:hypothetical protein
VSSARLELDHRTERLLTRREFAKEASSPDLRSSDTDGARERAARYATLSCTQKLHRRDA